jgi:hypothetical protein
MADIEEVLFYAADKTGFRKLVLVAWKRERL